MIWLNYLASHLKQNIIIYNVYFLNKCLCVKLKIPFNWKCDISSIHLSHFMLIIESVCWPLSVSDSSVDLIPRASKHLLHFFGKHATFQTKVGTCIFTHLLCYLFIQYRVQMFVIGFRKIVCNICFIWITEYWRQTISNTAGRFGAKRCSVQDRNCLSDNSLHIYKWKLAP